MNILVRYTVCLVTGNGDSGISQHKHLRMRILLLKELLMIGLISMKRSQFYCLRRLVESARTPVESL